MKIFISIAKRICDRKGFTMIESLIGLTVIIMAITGPLYVAVKSVTSAKYTREAVAAQSYGESVIEQLRHDRDSIFIACLYSRPSCPILLIDTAPELPSEAAWRLFKTYYTSYWVKIADQKEDFIITSPGRQVRYGIANAGWSGEFLAAGVWNCTAGGESPYTGPFDSSPSSKSDTYPELFKQCQVPASVFSVCVGSTTADDLYSPECAQSGFTVPKFNVNVQITSIPPVDQASPPDLNFGTCASGLYTDASCYDYHYNDDLLVQVGVSYKVGTSWRTATTTDFIRSRM